MISNSLGRGRLQWSRMVAGALVSTVLGCGSRERPDTARTPPVPRGDTLVVRETTIATVIQAFSKTAPVRHAVLSTKLIGSVGTVRVVEGAHVRTGELLARIDAREVVAARAQAAGSVAAAEAVEKEAETQAARIRALYTDSAAPRAQLDATEAALARATAGVATARAAAEAADASVTYAEIRAPFDGIVTARYVDPGSLVTPGAPAFAVDDESRLRVSAPVPPRVAQGVVRRAVLRVTVEDQPTTAQVEGIVPVTGAALYTINALVDNRDHRFLAGSAATVSVPAGTHCGIKLPVAAILRDGDLTGVRVRTSEGESLRWIRVAPIDEHQSEVLAGLRSGDVVVVHPQEVRDR